MVGISNCSCASAARFRAFELRTLVQLWRVIAIVCLALAPRGAWALDVGSLRWKPASDQAPYAEIELSDKTPIDPSVLRVSIASREAYAVAGLIYHPGLATAQISLQNSADGYVILRLVGLPQNTPSLDLLVVVNNRLSLSLAEYRVDLQLGPHEVAPLPAGTLQAKARIAARAKTSEHLPASPLPADNTLLSARSAVLAWAQAWSRRDLDTYIGAYTADYAGNQANETRQGWIDQRRTRIRARKHISVELAGLQLERQSNTVAATFEQHYRSDGLIERSRKRLLLVSVNGQWLISRETVLH